MIDADEAFLRRRLLEETYRAVMTEDERAREAHLAWAHYYDSRLGGRPAPEPSAYSV